MVNNFFVKFSALVLLAFVVSSIANFDNTQIEKSNSTAGIISAIVDFFSSDDDGISNCSEGGVDLQCPSDATSGCYCGGGVLGLQGKIWQNNINDQFLNYSEAVSYCESLGDEWKVPSPEDFSTIYNYDIRYIYSDVQPIKPDWFLSASSSFWTSYTDGVRNTFMIINYGLIYYADDQNIKTSVACVKDLYNDNIYAFGENLSIEGLGDVSAKINGKYIKNAEEYNNDFASITYNGQSWRLSMNDAQWLKPNDYSVVGAGEIMWQRTQSDTPLNWEQGRVYCEDLTLAGFDDWRLPSRSEVESVCSSVDTCANNYWADSGQEDYYMPEFNSWNSNAGGYAPATARCIRANDVSPLGEYSPTDTTYNLGMITVSKTGTKVVSTSSTVVKTTEVLLNTESKIVDVALEDVVYNVNIDDVSKKITVGLQNNTDTSKLKIYIYVSNGAKLFNGANLLEAVEKNKYQLNGLVSSLMVMSEDGNNKNTYNIVAAYPPSVSLKILNDTIYEKQTTKITWTPIGAKTCVASGNDTGWTSGSAPSAIDGDHTWTTGQLGIDMPNTPKTYVYGIKCSNSAGDTNIVSKSVKVLPDIYTTPRGSSRMSVVAQEAGVSGLNEFVLIKTDIRKTFENPKAHQTACPTGYTLCIEDNNDDNGNYILIGIKQ